jgi:methyl-accepting chemotaxis protein
MTQNDKIKLKALLPTVQGTYGLVKSASAVASATVENQLAPLNRLRNVLTSDVIVSTGTDIKTKDDFSVACLDLNTFLQTYFESLREATELAESYQSNVTRDLDALLERDIDVNIDAFVKTTNKSIESLSALTSDGKTTTTKFTELFGKIDETFRLFAKQLDGNSSVSEIEALIDELSTASKQVVNSVNVVATSLELLKSLVASEAK